MHGLIFETSIWLLAGSTRYLTTLAKRSAPSLFQNLCAPTARRRKKPFSADETVCVGSQLLTTPTLFILPCSRCSVPNSNGNLHRTRAKNAEIRSQSSKKVRYHLQSFELGPHKSNWRKKPPRTGRFFIIDAHNNRKKNAVAVSMKKTTTGGQPQKKNHRRERRIGNPRTQTPIRCQRMKHRSSQGDSAKNPKPIRTPKNEPRWFKPLENDWILIFFLFYPYYFLNAAVAPCLLLHDCIFRQVWATHTCLSLFRSDRIF